MTHDETVNDQAGAIYWLQPNAANAHAWSHYLWHCLSPPTKHTLAWLPACYMYPRMSANDQVRSCGGLVLNVLRHAHTRHLMSCHDHKITTPKFASRMKEHPRLFTKQSQRVIVIIIIVIIIILKATFQSRAPEIQCRRYNERWTYIKLLSS
jgi:hypothetical protein